MAKDHQSYWKSRMDDIFAYLDETDLEFFHEIQDTYSKYNREIQKEIFAFYQKYAQDHNISLQEAKQNLLGEDLSDYVQNANNYRKSLEKDPDALERLNEQYQAAKITRLEALNAEVTYRLLKMNQELQNSFYDYLKSTAQYVYKNVMFGNTQSTLNSRAIETILNMKWNGRNYSEAIWGNVDTLASELKQVFTNGFIRGSGPADMARELRKKFNVSRARAETLVRTDGTHVINNTTVRRYKDAGLTKYQYHAHVDSRTTETCKDLNGKIFEIDDYEPGKNAPPMHYNCRSIIVPDDKEIEMEPEFADKAKKANADYVRNKEDKAAYKDFSRILKDSMPSFEDFANMRYNGDKDWDKLNRQFRTLDEIRGKSWNNQLKDKARDAYYEFDKNGHEFSSHALGRFLDRMRKEGLSTKDAVTMLNKEPNFFEPDKNRKIWFYDKYAFIKNSDGTEVVTVVYRKNGKPKGGENPWKSILK